MNNNEEFENEFSQSIYTFYKYLNYWPFYILSLICFVIIAFIFLRYEDKYYLTDSRIEIIEDSKDSDVSLPTELTIFNRSTINLENEIEKIMSYRIIGQVVENLNLNVKFYEVGNLKSTQLTQDQALNIWEAKINYLHDLTKRTNYSNITLEFKDEKLTMIINGNGEKVFDQMFISDKALPFEISFKRSYKNLDGRQFKIEIHPYENIVKQLRSRLNVEKVGRQSDILSISTSHPNKNLSKSIINNLISNFDKDGILDRQLIFKRTIEFIDSRFSSLKFELDSIENNKQIFKQKNDLIDIKYNATSSSEQMILYNTENFQIRSQLDIINYLLDDITINDTELIPNNLGINDDGINNLINEFNNLIIKKSNYRSRAGENNLVIKNINIQIGEILKNITQSLELAKKKLEIRVSNIDKKEAQFESNYRTIPENEKILRSIEREQEIKEALFLLLLQKREEAAINFAVTHPSIKIIDYASSSLNATYPNSRNIYLVSFLAAMILPTIILFIKFTTDTKIRSREDISKKLNDIPIIGEIPYISDPKLLNKIVGSTDRDNLSESMRMVVANINFLRSENENNNVFLVTSTIKGEGKTIVSMNTASVLSNKNLKVLLIGADLRNPQLHKFLNIDRNQFGGLSEYIFSDDKKWDKFLLKNDNLDILLSGSIPPNPAQLLSSTKFKNLINEVKKEYDYVVIDSAPCLLVSDTFEISKNVGSTIYVTRSNYTDIKLLDFVTDSIKQEKLKNIALIFNGVGADNFGYKYGYKYGYNYSYNYGYGYGYGSKKTIN